MKAFTLFLEAMANNPTRVVLTTTSVFVFWVFGAWTLGFTPAFGEGFARAEDMQSVRSQLLENAIIEARTRYCEAPRGTPSKQFFLKTVNAKTREYYDLTGHTYDLPRCDELVYVIG